MRLNSGSAGDIISLISLVAGPSERNLGIQIENLTPQRALNNGSLAATSDVFQARTPGAATLFSLLLTNGVLYFEQGTGMVGLT